jgi:lipid-binding SYLF domain-containing protein
MRIITIIASMFLGFVSQLGPTATLAASAEEQRQDVRSMTRDTLQRLQALRPGVKQVMQKSAGYAVFSNFGMKIFLVGGGTGKGMAVDSKTKKETFMKMVEAQAGLGLGIKKFKVVFFFETRQALDDFINSGWEFGGQATAAAQAGGYGDSLAGAMSVRPGVWMYQLTDEGLALELTGKGTKFYKDDELN